MKSICFFSHFHNGDIFHIKSFLKDISSQFKTKYYIAHPNNPIITSDLDMEYISIPYGRISVNFKEKQNTFAEHQKHFDVLNGQEYARFIDTEECLYINTWIGVYFCQENEYSGECSLRSFHRMFSFIYEKLNEEFTANLKLGPVHQYYPFVDYSRFDCSNVDIFLEKNNTKKILICNGPCLSGQSSYNGDMSEILKVLALKNPDKTFIATKKFDTKIENMQFTDDIIKSNDCDLNEISYLSRFCYLIIGKSSGPFCFTLNKENINDESKTFLSYGNSECQCLTYGIETKCSFNFQYFEGVDKLSKTISELL